MATIYSTYSFLNIAATLTGPGGAIPLGSGSGVAEEGITVAQAEDKNKMDIGADGTGMNTLHADKSGEISIRLLKSSPTNNALQTLYNFQSISSANWGQNVLLISDTARGDIITCIGVAFRRRPSLTYSKDPQMNEWQFTALQIDGFLGAG